MSTLVCTPLVLLSSQSDMKPVYASDLSIVGDTFTHTQDFDCASGTLATLFIVEGGLSARVLLYPPWGSLSVTDSFTPVWGKWLQSGVAPVGVDSLPITTLLFSSVPSPVEPPFTNTPSNEVTLPTAKTTAAEVTSITDLFMSMAKDRVGEPVELFEFSFGRNLKWNLTDIADKNVYRWTSGNDIVTKGVTQYLPRAIHRDEIQQTVDMGRATLTLTVPKNNEIAQMFVAGTPAFPIALQVHKAYVNADSVLDYMVMFTGRVSAVSFGKMEAKITCDPIYSSIKRQGLRKKYETMCNHVLFSPSCGVDRDLKGVAAPSASFTPPNALEPSAQRTIIYISNDDAFAAKKVEVRENGQLEVKATATEKDVSYVTSSGYYTGGMVKLADDTMHLISKHFTGGVSLLRPLPTNSDLTGMVMYPGCDHSYTTCKSDKFNNAANYGGFPYMPDTNPFVGTHVPSGG